MESQEYVIIPKMHTINDTEDEWVHLIAEDDMMKNVLSQSNEDQENILNMLTNRIEVLAKRSEPKTGCVPASTQSDSGGKNKESKEEEEKKDRYFKKLSEMLAKKRSYTINLAGRNNSSRHLRVFQPRKTT